jgi:stage III sporulation protein AA
MRGEVDRLGRDNLKELRLRLGYPPALLLKNRTISITGMVTREDLMGVVNAASRFSPWAADSVSKGFLTASGGHRIGIGGQVIRHQGHITGIREPTMLCIRVARDFPGLAVSLKEISGSVLIIGPPGSGKTTLMRDLIRQKSGLHQGSVAVVDERGELFPCVKNTWSYSLGPNTDVLTGAHKQEGIEMLLRTMGPRWIAVDEISSEEDCSALYRAGWCGVTLLATAHAESRKELLNRPLYRPLVENKLFDKLVIMARDQTWHLEDL